MSWHQRAQNPRERGAPPSVPLPTSQAGRTREHKRRARFPERKGPGLPPRSRPPARRLTGRLARARWCSKQRGRGATTRDARPWRRPAGLPRAPSSRRQLRLALLGDPPHTRRGSGERGAGQGRADGQARGPMGGWELARGEAQAWFRPRLGSSRSTFLRLVPRC